MYFHFRLQKLMCFSLVVLAALTACSSSDTATSVPATPLCKVATECDDGNACTTDLCDKSSGCAHTAKDCDDGDACTKDSCAPDTGCKHKALVCDDGVECTTDKCDPNSGCKVAIDNTACDDGDTCTTDKCDKAAGCTHTDKDCNDNDACTSDACAAATGCTHAAKDCDDGIACTLDKCDLVAGCKNTASPGSCDDGLSCTVDKCDPTSGCKSTPDAAACDDGNKCTADVCDKVASCVHDPVSCSDGDPCTDDKCIKASGCVSAKADCDDSVECTADICDKSGICQHNLTFGAKCGTGGTCDAAGKCGQCAPKCDTGSCNDGCGGFCPGSCNDGNACTDSDACNSGKCQGAQLNCDDANACTTDSCDQASGCKHANNASAGCNDGNPCTGNENCSSGACSGTKLTCDDQNECTTDACDSKNGCQNTAKSNGSACSAGSGKCLDGGCCVPKCSGKACGDDGCGGQCGSCGSTSACSAGQCVLVAQPKIESVATNTFSVSGNQVFPTYIGHLYGTELNGSPIDFAAVVLKNPTTAPVSVVLTVQLQGFSAASDTKVDLAAGQSKSVTVNLTFDFKSLYALTTANTASFKVTLTMAGQLVDTYQAPMIKVATKNTVFWQVSDANGKVADLHSYVAAMVTPKNLEVQKLLSEAGSNSYFNTMGGYQMLGSSKKFTYTVSPGKCVSATVHYHAGQTFQVSVSASGGLSNNCSYGVYDLTEYALTQDVGMATLASSGALGSAVNSQVAANTGSYQFMFCNPNSNFSDRLFAVSRTMGNDEVVQDQAGAIYKAMQARGLLYTDVSTDYFDWAQNIKTPGESLFTNSSNCIDGTLVFASALEAMGMEPLVVIRPGHAYLAVREFPGAKLEDYAWTGLETTMVGTSASSEAFAKGNDNLLTDWSNGTFTAIVDVVALRKIGLVPGGY